MQRVRLEALSAVPSVIYACEDAGTQDVAGFKLYDDICTEEQWTRQEVPAQCRYYAEYFLADCNNGKADR